MPDGMTAQVVFLHSLVADLPDLSAIKESAPMFRQPRGSDRPSPGIAGIISVSSDPARLDVLIPPAINEIAAIEQDSAAGVQILTVFGSEGYPFAIDWATNMDEWTKSGEVTGQMDVVSIPPPQNLGRHSNLPFTLAVLNISTS